MYKEPFNHLKDKTVRRPFFISAYTLSRRCNSVRPLLFKQVIYPALKAIFYKQQTLLRRLDLPL